MPFGFGRGRHGWGRRRGRGFRSGRSFGPGGPSSNCICPNCGTMVPHRPASPCFQTKCPNCNSRMTRQFAYQE